METKILSETAAATILENDLINLAKRVSSGKVLTNRQREMIAEQAGQRSAGAWANNLTALADALGTTRQRLEFWRRKDGCPQPRTNGLHSVDAWRKFLRGHGVETGGKATGHDTRLQVAEDASNAQFIAVSNELPAAIRDALAGILPPAQVDQITLLVWLRLAEAQTAAASRQDLAGILDGEEPQYPDEIAKLCSRLDAE